MRSHRSGELSRRQQQLLSRSAQLRESLVQQSLVLRSPLALADQLRTGLHWVRQHPVWPLAALAWLVLRPPRRLLRWLPPVLGGWHLLLRAGQWLDRRANRPR